MLSLPVWGETRSCKSGTFCRQCREKSARGDRFRKSIHAGHVVPGDVDDFECPHGRGWNFKGVFHLQQICQSQDNCTLCRHPERGREWRRTQTRDYEVPGNLVDFPCPYGKPWLWSGQPTKATIPLERCFLLEHNQGVGDATLFTAAVRDLHLQYPGHFRTAFRGWCWELLKHNPYLEQDDGLGRAVKIECYTNDYSSDQPHFLYSFHKKLSEAIGVPIRRTKLGGDIHLSREELAAPPPIDGLNVVMFAGGKGDFTVKWWDPRSYQAVADHFRGSDVTIVQAGAAGHFHEPMSGVVNMTGKTSLREMIRLIYHADAVVSPISAGMHLAAAVPTRPWAPPRRPAVVIAGGREAPSFVQYPNHTLLHTVGQLSCCSGGACWKYKAHVCAGDKSTPDCEQRVDAGDGLTLARCMTMIRPAQVIEALERYLDVARQARAAELERRKREEEEAARQRARRFAIAEQNFPHCSHCPQYDGALEGGLAVRCKAKRRTCSCQDGRVSLHSDFCPEHRWSATGARADESSPLQILSRVGA